MQIREIIFVFGGKFTFPRKNRSLDGSTFFYCKCLFFVFARIKPPYFQLKINK